jgi:hypothetical protein
MKIFRRLFGEKDHHLKPERSYIEKLVRIEIRLLLEVVLTRHHFEAGKGIVAQVKRDEMDWFSVRSWQYGESRNPFGDYKFTCKPMEGALKWPVWIRTIPTSQFADIRQEVWRLAQERLAVPGDHPEQEELRRTVCEYASRLVIELFVTEEQARMPKPAPKIP